MRSFNVEAGRKNQKGEERYRKRERRGRANGRKGFLIVGPVVAVSGGVVYDTNELAVSR